LVVKPKPKKKKIRLKMGLAEWLSWRKREKQDMERGGWFVTYWQDMLKKWLVKKLKPRLRSWDSLSIVQELVGTKLMTNLALIDGSCIGDTWKMAMLVGVWTSTSELVKTLKCNSPALRRNLVWASVLMTHVLGLCLGNCVADWLCLVRVLNELLNYEKRKTLNRWMTFFKEKVNDLVDFCLLYFILVDLKVVKFLKRISSWWLDVMFSREAGVKVDFDIWSVDDVAKYCGEMEPVERMIFLDCSKFMWREAMYRSSAGVFEGYRNIQGGLAIWCNGPLCRKSKVSVEVGGKVKLIRTYQVLLLPHVVIEVLFGCFLDCEFVVSGDGFVTVYLPDSGDARGLQLMQK
jgi:hypothetical protein